MSKEIKRQGDGETGRRGDAAARRWNCVVIIVVLLLVGCARRDPEEERRAAVGATYAKLSTCLPEHLPTSADPHLQLALAAATREPEGLNVRLVGYAVNEAADFDLPVYLLSRGRWLIKEVGRVYVLDEECREYKLQGRKSTSARTLPLDGKIKLKAGEAFEVRLLFPPLVSKAQMGLLVYNGRVLPFSLSPTTAP